MYSLVRKNNRFSFVKSDRDAGPANLIKSIFNPGWQGTTWRSPSITEKKTWTTFLRTDRVDDPRFNSQILQSWQRCRRAEVDPVKGMGEKFMPVKELEHESENLVALAKPIMDTLYHCVKGSEFVIVLVDRKGYILNTVGGLKELKHADRLRFGPGANWAEECVGTNAIGTALALGHPVQVTGTEHYCESHHLWTCSTSPIRNQAGEIIGFMDISGPRERASAHQMGLIVAATHAVEDRIILDESYGKLYDINKYLEAILNSVSEGIIAVNGKGLITGINKVAAKAFRQHPREVIGKTINPFMQHDGRLVDFFNTRAAGFTKEEIVFKLPDGKVSYTATANPVFSEKNDNKGFVITFSPAEKTCFQVPPSKGTMVKFSFADIIGESKAIRRSMEMAKRVAPGPSTVLILGESGTGKELFAQAIHSASDYRAGPFVSLNCGAIPRELIQSELFGYADGAYTGAKRGGCSGKFETANGGTLFLDEIGEMPFEMQINLLRVLEEKAIVPIGGKNAIPVDVRIIAATNKSLFEEVSKGRFREDLYYRLNVISLALPPLRAREGDVRLLAQYWVEKISQKMGLDQKKVTPDVLGRFEKYHWPGNIRELVNAIEHAVNMSGGEDISVRHLPRGLRSIDAETPRPGADDIMTLSVMEKAAVKKALLFYDGNITRASKALGIGRNTFYEKMKKYGIA
ncbi:sigma-54-dependent Fis family transcriptional regulator [Desulfococcus sp.]|uniref:sigma-54-dependent Fis family transcriptional regulator n=1 Tax=Desulfococcus sp. TaxID=2025834 RepID=UPI0035944C76